MKRLAMSLVALVVAAALVVAVGLFVSGTVAAAPPVKDPAGSATTVLALTASVSPAPGETVFITPAGGLDVSNYARVRVVLVNKASPPIPSVCNNEAYVGLRLAEGGVELVGLNGVTASGGTSTTLLMEPMAKSFNILVKQADDCQTTPTLVDVYVYGR